MPPARLPPPLPAPPPSPRAAERSPTGRKRRADAKGLKLVGVRLRPEQVKALLREAKKRADRSGSALADKSELVREAVDAWLAKRWR